jgi:hypothetical protein
MADDDDTTTTTDDDDDSSSSSSSTGDAELEAIRSDPAAAKQTIESLKSEAAEYRRKLRKAEHELERTRTESLSDHERAVAEAEQRGRAAADAEHGRKLLEAQVLAAAAGKLRDPQDAIRYLNLEELLELDEGDRKIGDRIAELVKEKDYLAAANGDTATTRGVRSQGARTTPGDAKASDTDGSAWLRKAAGRR